MRKKLVIFANFLLVITLFVGACNSKMSTPSDYSSYKPVLMSRSDLLNSVALRPQRTIDTVFKVDFMGDIMLVGEIYKGIHLLDNLDPSNVRPLGFISIPGIIDFVVKDSIIFANNAVDLVSVKVVSPTEIQIVAREQDVFGELQPPDGRSMDPVFMRGHRPENTEIVAWVRDPNVQLHADSLFLVTNLLARDETHVFGLIGQSVVMFNNNSGILEYNSLTKANFDANYRIGYYNEYLFFYGANNLRVFQVQADNLTLVNEYTGINPSNYIDFWCLNDSCIMAVSFHSDANFWNLNNQLEIYSVGNFDAISLDTIIALSYPLDVKIRDSFLYVCDQGIKIFYHDSVYHQVYYMPSDAQALFFNDSLLVSIGESHLSQYEVKADSLNLLWEIPIEYSWVIK